MRSSSIKSLSVVTALVVALAVMPRAEAKTNHAGPSKFRGVKTTLTQLINRFLGISTQEDVPGDPWPKHSSTSDTTTTTTREISPKQIR